MDSTRTIFVHGTKDKNTKFTATVNGVPADYVSDALFSFTTSTALHGSATVSITVESGAIEVSGCTVTYPAVINNTSGYALFKQPIANPFATIGFSKVTATAQFTVKAGESFTYEHLMFNGPSRFNVITQGTVNKNDTVFVGNLIGLSFADNIISVSPEYNYRHRPNNVNSKFDLKKLYLCVWYQHIKKLIATVAKLVYAAD